MSVTNRLWSETRFLGIVCVLITLVCGHSIYASETDVAIEVGTFFEQYCIDCHSSESAEANINLEQLATAEQFAERFKDVKRVIGVLRSGQMPPREMPQPKQERRLAVSGKIQDELDRFARENAGDPGSVVMRRLTSAEYSYVIEDLTDLKLDFSGILTGDAVGGEGFTNVGTVQFVQDSTIERYLEAAHLVASHAVIGAGSLQFFGDPGQSGLELSAINRIQQIYQQNGYRSGAGEGGEPFGLDLYPKAFLVAWKFRYRNRLGLESSTLEDLADEYQLSRRFVHHVNDVINQQDHAFPLSRVVMEWESLPVPTQTEKPAEAAVYAQCEEIAARMRNWQTTLASATGDQEEVAVLTATSVQVHPHHSFEARIKWEKESELGVAELSVTSADSDIDQSALVVWKRPQIHFRMRGKRDEKPIPLFEVLTAKASQRLQLGQHPLGKEIGSGDFVIPSGTMVPISFRVPEGMTDGNLLVEVTLDDNQGRDSVVRCTIADGKVEGETAAEIGSTSILLADPTRPGFSAWKAGVVEFGTLFPQISHREPAPSDRDPIPAPFDNTYNTAERNKFHYVIKYHRDDDFLVEHLLDDEARLRLDEAWVDIISAFDYHDTYVRFVQEKFGLQPVDRKIRDWTPELIAELPDEPRQYVRRLYASYVASQQALVSAESGHLEDLLKFAERAWRRPLGEQEQDRIRHFYRSLRSVDQIDHTLAVRAVLARILTAPAFLYRLEPESHNDEVYPLSSQQLANRLSFFLWSSRPDEELLRSARSGAIQKTEELARQSRRMLRDPKARRLATEFFGQWFGFYHFSKYQGVDRHRFPELTDSLKESMENEANAFFEYVVREDRPVSDILFADYSFLNRELAKHYQVPVSFELSSLHQRIEGLNAHHRGGLLGMAAVLATTSAPLRTSPVKRGDWVLRRVLGTPVPPPPADAGSIAADDAQAEGKTIREQLVAHRREASCVSCHARIDPPGFSLENFDPIGRYRETYRDGQPVDSSAELANGDRIDGPDGLRRFLNLQADQFYRTLSTKLLGYGLGRSERLSDQELLQSMVEHACDDGRFSTLVVDIVTSRQFRHRRGHDHSVSKNATPKSQSR